MPSHSAFVRSVLDPSPALAGPDAAVDPAGVDPAGVLARAIEARLAASGMMDQARFAAFIAAQRRLGLTHGQRPLCRHLSPFLLSEATYTRIARAAEGIGAALARVAARALVDPAMADELGLTAEEQALAAIDPGYPQPLVIGRLDMLLGSPAPSASEFQFIEFNADSPAGVTDQLLVERTLMALPHMLAVRGRLEARTPTPHIGLLRALRRVYAAWGGAAARPSIAIVDWADGDTAAELRVLAEIFSAAGHPTFIADPGELRYDAGRLWVGPHAIDLVYRRVIMHELVARGGFGHPLFQAYLDRAVCVANSFRTKSMNKKASFAVLSDPAFSSLFTPAQRALIAAHIPWTRRVRPGPTSWRDQTVDLFQLLVEHREDFVLKPNDEYGGKGVLLGWTTAPADWQRALARAGEAPLIAQARTAVGTVRMPTFDPQATDGIGHEEIFFDICPFLFAGRMEGAMVRLSSAPVSNVSSGGGVSGLLIADGGVAGAGASAGAGVREEPRDV